jgi:hypothetical protein
MFPQPEPAGTEILEPRWPAKELRIITLPEKHAIAFASCRRLLSPQFISPV